MNHQNVNESIQNNYRKNIHRTEKLHHSFMQDNDLQQLSSKCTWFVFDK